MLKLFYKIFLLSIIALNATLLYQKNTYAYHTLRRIDPLPYTQKLISEDNYRDAEEYLAYFMQYEYVSSRPEAVILLDDIQNKRNSLSYKSAKIWEGIRTGTSDETEGQVSAIGSDFCLIGDLRDLAIEGTHYFKDEEVDTVLVSLSSLGLVATAGTLFTAGAGSTVKGGTSVLKLAQKSKMIPLWLGKYLTRPSKEIRQSKNIETITPLLKNIDEMQEQVGLKNTLKMLSNSKNMEEFKALSKLSQHYGKDTALMLDLSKGKLLTHADTLKYYDKNTIKLASTYTDSGFIHLLKGGEKNFLKSTARMKAYAKVGYKGEIWKVFLWLMKHLSDTILIAMLGIASLLLFPFKKLIFPRKSV